MKIKVLCSLILVVLFGVAHGQSSPYSLNVFTPQIFTATGQTGTPIQLNGLSGGTSTVGSSYTLGSVTVTGTSLTTITFQVLGSSDNGGTYYAMPIYTVASPTTPAATTITATANGLYQVNLAGLTHVKFATSGTFTATNVTITLTATPNGQLARSSGGGGTVTAFSAPSGGFPSWLTPSVTNNTTTPSLALSASSIPNSALANSSVTVNTSTGLSGGGSVALGGTITVGPDSSHYLPTNTSGTFCVWTGTGTCSTLAPNTNNILVGNGSGGIQDSGKTAPAGALVGTTDTQSLTSKTLDGVTPATMGYVDPTSSIQTQLNTNATAITARLVAANNLSDLASAATARTNLGLGTAATSPNQVSISGTTCTLGGSCTPQQNFCAGYGCSNGSQVNVVFTVSTPLTITADVAASDTSVAVASTAGYPSVGCGPVSDTNNHHEAWCWGGTDPTHLLLLHRGVNGSTASAFTASASAQASGYTQTLSTSINTTPIYVITNTNPTGISWNTFQNIAGPNSAYFTTGSANKFTVNLFSVSNDVAEQANFATSTSGNVNSGYRGFHSTCYNGSATVDDYWNFQAFMGTGSSATSTLNITHTGGCGGYSLFNLPSVTAIAGQAQSTSPLCPNGPNGTLTTTGCSSVSAPATTVNGASGAVTISGPAVSTAGTAITIASDPTELFQARYPQGTPNLFNDADLWNGTTPATPANTTTVSGRLGSSGTLSYGPYAYAVNAFPGQGVTGYMPVYGYSSITSNASTDAGYGCFYDASYTLVASSCFQNGSSSYTISVPSGAYYYRQTFPNSTASYMQGMMVVAGGTLPSTYTSFGYAAPSVVDTKITNAVQNNRGGLNYQPATVTCVNLTVGGSNACTATGGRQIRFGVWGDSYSAIFAQAWQKVLLARTGGTIVYQDARGGRSYDNSLECYGITGMASWTTYSTNNYNPGNYDATTLPSYCGTGGNNIGYQAGQSLATNLLNVDALLLYLGTNDVSATIGAWGDVPTSGTFYGNMNGLVNALQTANKTMRIIMVTNNFNTGEGTTAQQQAVANAEVDFGSRMGIPVLNMNANSGINSVNAATLLRDGTHPTDWAFANLVGPAIANFVIRWF